MTPVNAGSYPRTSKLCTELFKKKRVKFFILKWNSIRKIILKNFCFSEIFSEEIFYSGPLKFVLKISITILKQYQRKFCSPESHRQTIRIYTRSTCALIIGSVLYYLKLQPQSIVHIYLKDCVVTFTANYVISLTPKSERPLSQCVLIIFGHE